MTPTEIYNVLTGSGYPVTYLAFPADECPAMPFITWQETGSNNLGAVGVVYKPVRSIQVDHFTAGKNWAAEAALEQTLNNNGIFWNKIQTLDDAEACQRYTYTFEVLGEENNGEQS